MTLADFTAALDELRARGVSKCKWNPGFDGFDVEFFEPQSGPTKPTKTAQVVDEKCRCGHHLYDEHVNGLCIVNGCDPVTCSPPPEPK